ncbi:hypothetical protein, partial [Pseudomonas sp. MWU12-2115]|uniref:hypothetical protein n=1 Tax=Pseudomonas sp. MWU12-2115 TaxID=2071713 RepID=UPI001C49AC10
KNSCSPSEVYTLGNARQEAVLTDRLSHDCAARNWLRLGSRDEVRGWREGACFSSRRRQTIFNGDDHRLNNWPKVLPGVVAWARAPLSSLS